MVINDRITKAKIEQWNQPDSLQNAVLPISFRELSINLIGSRYLSALLIKTLFRRDICIIQNGLKENSYFYGKLKSRLSGVDKQIAGCD